MKNLLYVFILFLVACISDNPIISISNKSQATYDSIKVFTSINSQIVFMKVKPKDVVKGKIVFDKKNTADGEYHVQLFLNGKMVIEKGFGYFTNGASLNRSFKIIIEADTIRIISK